MVKWSFSRRDHMGLRRHSAESTNTSQLPYLPVIQMPPPPTAGSHAIMLLVLYRAVILLGQSSVKRRNESLRKPERENEFRPSHQQLYVV